MVCSLMMPGFDLSRTNFDLGTQELLTKDRGPRKMRISPLDSKNTEKLLRYFTFSGAYVTMPINPEICVPNFYAFFEKTPKLPEPRSPSCLY